MASGFRQSQALSLLLPRQEGRLAAIEQSIVVNVPVQMAYNQWTQFEEFPRFMDGVESVRQLDDKRLHWRANIGGKVKEWDAEITEQHPDERIAWTARSGARNAAVVTFHRLDENRTKIMLQVDYEPKGPSKMSAIRSGSCRAVSRLIWTAATFSLPRHINWMTAASPGRPWS
jgi:uncharacterized membrane protein